MHTNSHLNNPRYFSLISISGIQLIDVECMGITNSEEQKQLLNAAVKLKSQIMRSSRSSSELELTETISECTSETDSAIFEQKPSSIPPLNLEQLHPETESLDANVSTYIQPSEPTPDPAVIQQWGLWVKLNEMAASSPHSCDTTSSPSLSVTSTGATETPPNPIDTQLHNLTETPLEEAPPQEEPKYASSAASLIENFPLLPTYSEETLLSSLQNAICTDEQSENKVSE